MGTPANKGDLDGASTYPLWSTPCTTQIHLFIAVVSPYTVRASSGFWLVTISGTIKKGKLAGHITALVL